MSVGVGGCAVIVIPNTQKTKGKSEKYIRKHVPEESWEDDWKTGNREKRTKSNEAQQAVFIIPLFLHQKFKEDNISPFFCCCTIIIIVSSNTLFLFALFMYLCNAFIYLVNRNFTQRCCTKRCRCALECNKKMCYFFERSNNKIYIIIERCVVLIENENEEEWRGYLWIIFGLSPPLHRILDYLLTYSYITRATDLFRI